MEKKTTGTMKNKVFIFCILENSLKKDFRHIAYQFQYVNVICR